MRSMLSKMGTWGVSTRDGAALGRWSPKNSNTVGASACTLTFVAACCMCWFQLCPVRVDSSPEVATLRRSCNGKVAHDLVYACMPIHLPSCLPSAVCRWFPARVLQCSQAAANPCTLHAQLSHSSACMFNCVAACRVLFTGGSQSGFDSTARQQLHPAFCSCRC
jgi:hypothetical protein